MRIIELNIAEFGCLKDKHISVSEGLNIIAGDNESGKSTVMLFIRFMLYGLPRKSAKNYDRERSLSFSGHRAEGSMTVEHDGRHYRIERRAVLGTRMSETAKVICTDTGEALRGEPGEIFLGVPYEVYESSCSVSQMGTANISKAGAEGAIENMLVSADESIDVGAVLEKIDAVRKEYKLNRGDGGRIYDTECQLSVLRSRQRAVTDKYLEYNGMCARLERKQNELCAAEQALAVAEERYKDVCDAGLIERFDALAESEKRLHEMKERLDMLEASVTETGFIPDEGHVAALRISLVGLGEAETRLAERRSEYDRAVAESQGKDELAHIGERIEAEGGKDKILSRVRTLHGRYRSCRIAGSVLMGVGFPAIAAALLLFVSMTIWTVIPIAVIGVALAVLGMIVSLRARKARLDRDALCDSFDKSFEELETYLLLCVSRLAESRGRIERAITERTRVDLAEEDKRNAVQKLRTLVLRTRECQTEDADELSRAAEAEIERTELFCAERRRLTKEHYGLQVLVMNEKKSLSEHDEAALRQRLEGRSIDTDARSVSEAERQVKFNRAKQATLMAEVSNLRENIAAYRVGLGDSPVEIGDRIQRLEQRLARDTAYFDALMLAKQSIEQASVTMSGNVTPELSRRAGELLARISGGRHSAVQTTKSLDVSVEQDGFNVASELLSGGTREAAYLCLRISLMMRLFDGNMPPLMLDEALCQFDDERVGIVLDLLTGLGKTGLQTLLFTCHSREARICAERGYTFSHIRL